MSSRSFYRLSLVAPIILIAGVVALNYPHRNEDSTPESDYYAMASALLTVSIPYDLIALWFGWWMRHKSETEIRRMFYVMPIYLMALNFVCLLTWFIVSEWPSPDPRGLWNAMAWAMFGLVVSYVYVLVAIGLCWLLRNVGLIRSDPEPAV